MVISQTSRETIQKMITLKDRAFFPQAEKPTKCSKNFERYWGDNFGEMYGEMLKGRKTIVGILESLSIQELNEIYRVFLRGNRIWAQKNTFSTYETKADVSEMISLENDPNAELFANWSKQNYIDCFLAATPTIPRYLAIGLNNIDSCENGKEGEWA